MVFKLCILVWRPALSHSPTHYSKSLSAFPGINTDQTRFTSLHRSSHNHAHFDHVQHMIEPLSPKPEVTSIRGKKS